MCQSKQKSRNLKINLCNFVQNANFEPEYLKIYEGYVQNLN
jgi:hypothetical protein